MLKLSSLNLEKQKGFIPKKNICLAIVNITTKKGLYLLTQFFGKVLILVTSILIVLGDGKHCTENRVKAT